MGRGRNWSSLREKKFLFWGLSKRQQLGRERVSRELWKARQKAYVPSTERRAFITLLRQIRTTSPPLTFWIAKFHKPNSSAEQTGEKPKCNMIFYQQSSSFAISLSKEQFTSIIPQQQHQLLYKKMLYKRIFCIYESMMFSSSSPKYHRLHMIPIAGCSAAAGRLKRDWKFSTGVLIKTF